MLLIQIIMLPVKWLCQVNDELPVTNSREFKFTEIIRTAELRLVRQPRIL
jgi:hypothetical protein